MAKTPSGTIDDSAPSKVTICVVSGWMTGSPNYPSEGNATVIAVIGRSVIPKAFETRIRIWSAPIVMWSVYT